MNLTAGELADYSSSWLEGTDSEPGDLLYFTIDKYGRLDVVPEETPDGIKFIMPGLKNGTKSQIIEVYSAFYDAYEKLYNVKF